MDNYTDNVIQAIETIVDQKLNSVNFDRTEICKIISQDQDDKQKYWASNGNMRFEVYSLEPNQFYSPNAQVYVLVPKGDYSSRKVIISGYSEQRDTTVNYSKLFDNVIFSNSYELVTKSNPLNENIINVGQLEKRTGFGVYDYIGIEFSLTSEITSNAEYFIKLDLLDAANRTILKDENSLRFSSKQIQGNPYILNENFVFQHLFYFPELISNIEVINQIKITLYSEELQANEILKLNNCNIYFGYDKNNKTLQSKAVMSLYYPKTNSQEIKTTYVSPPSNNDLGYKEVYNTISEDYKTKILKLDWMASEQEIYNSGARINDINDSLDIYDIYWCQYLSTPQIKFLESDINNIKNCYYNENEINTEWNSNGLTEETGFITLYYKTREIDDTGNEISSLRTNTNSFVRKEDNIVSVKGLYYLNVGNPDEKPDLPILEENVTGDISQNVWTTTCPKNNNKNGIFYTCIQKTDKDGVVSWTEPECYSKSTTINKVEILFTTELIKTINDKTAYERNLQDPAFGLSSKFFDNDNLLNEYKAVYDSASEKFEANLNDKFKDIVESGTYWQTIQKTKATDTRAYIYNLQIPPFGSTREQNEEQVKVIIKNNYTNEYITVDGFIFQNDKTIITEELSEINNNIAIKVELEYGTSNSHVKEPTTWSTTIVNQQINSYLWFRQKILNKNNKTVYSPAMCIANGTISNIKFLYYLQLDNMNAPIELNNNNFEDSGWTYSCPEYESNGYFWTCLQYIDATSGIVYYTKPIKVLITNPPKKTDIEFLGTELTEKPKWNDSKWDTIYQKQEGNNTVYLWQRTKITYTNDIIQYGDSINIDNQVAKDGKTPIVIVDLYYINTKTETSETQIKESLKEYNYNEDTTKGIFDAWTKWQPTTSQFNSNYTYWTVLYYIYNDESIRYGEPIIDEKITSIIETINGANDAAINANNAANNVVKDINAYFTGTTSFDVSLNSPNGIEPNEEGNIIDGEIIWYDEASKITDPYVWQIYRKTTVGGTVSYTNPVLLNAPPPILYTLVSSAHIIHKKTNNTLTPSTISFHGKKYTGETNINYYWVIEINGSRTTTYESVSNFYTIKQIPFDTKSIIAKMYQDPTKSVLLGEIVIPVITDGEDGVSTPTVFLTNEFISFSADANGKILDNSPQTSIIMAYSGTTQIKPKVNTIEDTHFNIKVKEQEGTYNIELTITPKNENLGGITSINGVINIPIAYPIETTLQLNWAKINTGMSGAPGTSYWLTSSDSIIKKTNNGFSPASITCKALHETGTSGPTPFIEAKWQIDTYSFDNTRLDSYKTAGTSVTISLYNKTLQKIHIQLLKNEIVVDEQTIPVLTDGTGVEFIYYASNSAVQEWTDQNFRKEDKAFNLEVGWTLTPPSVTEEKQYIYISTRIKRGNDEENSQNQGQFSDPVLWSKPGKPGIGIKKINELYYLQFDTSIVELPTQSTEISDEDDVDTWTTIFPSFRNGGAYWSCVEYIYENDMKTYIGLTLVSSAISLYDKKIENLWPYLNSNLVSELEVTIDEYNPGVYNDYDSITYELSPYKQTAQYGIEAKFLDERETNLLEDKYYKIFWAFPKSATMLKPLKDEFYHGYDKEVEDDDDYYEYSALLSHPSGIGVQDKTFIYGLQQYFGYNKTNNTIWCKIIEYNQDPIDNENPSINKIFIGKLKQNLKFGLKGVQGTDFRFNIVLNEDSRPALQIPIDDSPSDFTLKLKATLQDSNGNELDFDEDKIQWGWYQQGPAEYKYQVDFGEGLETRVVKNRRPILNQETGKSITIKWEDIVNTEVPYDWIETDGCSIIQAVLKSYPNTDGRKIDLIAYFPIATCYKEDYYLSGPTTIVYDREGTYLGAQDLDIPYQLFLRGEEIKNSDTIEIIYTICEVYEEGYAPSTQFVIKPDEETGENNYLNPCAIYPCNKKFFISVEIMDDENASYSGVQYYQPLLIVREGYWYNRDLINKWDGAMVIDEEENAILAASFIAGRKESDNSFTGVILGEVGKDVDGAKNGIYGVKGGQLRYKFTEDGEAYIGTGEYGINLSQDGILGISMNELEINAQSKKFLISSSGEKGYHIRIKDKFSVNTDGKMSCVSGNLGGWEITDKGILGMYEMVTETSYSNRGSMFINSYEVYNEMGQYGSWPALAIGASLAGSTNGNPTINSYKWWEAPFRVNGDGTLIATGAKIEGNISATTGKIGFWNIDSTKKLKFTVYNGTRPMSLTFEPGQYLYSGPTYIEGEHGDQRMDKFFVIGDVGIFSMHYDEYSDRYICRGISYGAAADSIAGSTTWTSYSVSFINP